MNSRSAPGEMDFTVFSTTLFTAPCYTKYNDIDLSWEKTKFIKGELCVRWRCTWGKGFYCILQDPIHGTLLYKIY